ncbi:hypothetical protein BCR32DRAFT_265734 [Anaeromyces robustus]|uniref:Uncharacterized protein n=1 Tax=Anaeromyces robustus TaxID=1754192 RepID=A0A1Y1XHU8_9FUNG|nr:hypothetical protein BCR32DRAFT_265734 [Anaeromyces robustus]|eukprot:ORX85338.1 hypothetical protein BCR32DRAFT_265734 [Anaeromyces robustus]
MTSILSRNNITKCLKFFSNMFMIFVFSRVLRIRLDWIFISMATTVISLWLCARSLSAITKEINSKDIKFVNYRVEEAISFMLLSTLIYHFTILLMFVSFIRSPDTKYIVYKICYITIFELVPLIVSSALMFLRWKDNMKPALLKISNYVLLITLACLTGWVVYVFYILWGNELTLSLTKNYTPFILCVFCAVTVIIFGIISVFNIPNEEYENIYEIKKDFFAKMNNKTKTNNTNTNETSINEKNDEVKKDL